MNGALSRGLCTLVSNNNNNNDGTLQTTNRLHTCQTAFVSTRINPCLIHQSLFPSRAFATYDAASEEVHGEHGSAKQSAKAALSKTPVDYINKFIMRVHPDLIHGDTALVWDPKSDVNRNAGPGVRQHLQSMSIDDVRSHNELALAQLNSVIEYMRATPKSSMESLDPYRFPEEGVKPPQRQTFMFYVRVKPDSPDDLLFSIHAAEKPFEGSTAVANGSGNGNGSGSGSGGDGEGVGMKGRFKVVRARLRPPRDAHAMSRRAGAEEDNVIDGEISHMQMAVDSALIELLEGTADEIPIAEMENWKREQQLFIQRYVTLVDLFHPAMFNPTLLPVSFLPLSSSLLLLSLILLIFAHD